MATNDVQSDAAGRREPGDRGRVVRAGAGYRAEQGSDYEPGVSAETVGSQVIWLGLMTLPPFYDDPVAARPVFARLRAFRDDLVAGGVPAANLAELSMGMSHDFEAAIAEGSTIVRVGSAIFGPRTKP